MLAWIDYLSAFTIYDWAGGDFGGFGGVAQSPAAWAVPAWIALTITIIAVDVLATRAVFRACRSYRNNPHMSRADGE